MKKKKKSILLLFNLLSSNIRIAFLAEKEYQISVIYFLVTIQFITFIQNNNTNYERMVVSPIVFIIIKFSSIIHIHVQVENGIKVKQSKASSSHVQLDPLHVNVNIQNRTE